MKQLKISKSALIVFCLLAAITFSSCGGYEVTQDIQEPRWGSCPTLVTRVTKSNGLVTYEIMRVWSDDINVNTSDSIKCARYNEATKLMKKLEKIEATNCN